MRDILHREFELPSTPDETWNYLLDPSWLGDDGEVQPHVGGEGWVREGANTRWMLVEEVVEGERFVYRWASFTDEPTRVEITLAPTPEGTRVEIVESPLHASLKASLALR